MAEKDDMEKFNKDIWEVIFRNFKNIGQQGPVNEVSMLAAVLLKTSIELYTLSLKENSDIERLITEEVVPTIPKLRDGMKRMIKPTLH